MDAVKGKQGIWEILVSKSEKKHKTKPAYYGCEA